MIKGKSNKVTSVLFGSSFSKNYMMDICYSFVSDTGVSPEEIYKKWCSEIDSNLSGTGFWHQPETGEVFGPIDSDISEEEFEEIMSKSFENSVC